MPMGETRDILWNVPLAFIVLMYALLVALAAACVYAARLWSRRVALGAAAPDSHVDQRLRRTWRLVLDAFAQRIVVRERWGWTHAAFYLAFVGLFAGTTVVFINSDVRWAVRGLFGVDLYFFDGDFYVWFKTVMDVCFLVLVGG